jgi:integrase
LPALRASTDGLAASPQRIVRFILIALYTGARESAVCGAALEAIPGHDGIDLERAIFYRRPPVSAKRRSANRRSHCPINQPVAHLRRWKRRGQRFAVEWNGKAVRSIKKAFGNVVADSRLGDDVTPHVMRRVAAAWLMQAGADIWDQLAISA